MLGISDVQREGYMMAITDRRRPSYVNWIQGQPADNAGGNEHCAVYWTARTARNDIPCSNKCILYAQRNNSLCTSELYVNL